MTRLAVLLYDQHVGWLERTDEEDSTFAYTAEYAASGSVPLSVRLPVGTEIFTAKRVQPYLEGLLPENVGTREQWGQRLGTDPDDTFGMLAQMGWDCPGAVQFCPEDDLPVMRARAHEYQDVTDADIAQRIRTLTDEPASWTMPGEHWSLGGQQEKFALANIEGQWKEAHGSAATTHIFKPGIKALMHQALVEHVTMRAASKLGVQMADSQMLGFEDQWAIVVTRFDRLFDGEDVYRLHQEDMCQAVGRTPDRKYENRGGPGLGDMAKVVRNNLTTVPRDLRAVADFAVVNVVAGAPDGHSKNISLLSAPDGRRWVAPLFDLATGLAYDQAKVERGVAVSIGSERHVSRIRAAQWTKAAGVLGIPAVDLLDRVAYLASEFPAALDEALAEVDLVPGAADVATRAVPSITKHCRVMLENLRRPTG